MVTQVEYHEMANGSLDTSQSLESSRGRKIHLSFEPLWMTKRITFSSTFTRQWQEEGEAHGGSLWHPTQELKDVQLLVKEENVVV